MRLGTHIKLNTQTKILYTAPTMSDAEATKSMLLEAINIGNHDWVATLMNFEEPTVMILLGSCMFGDIDMYKLLMTYPGMDRIGCEHDSLVYAAMTNRADILELLLMNPDVELLRDGRSCLMIAIENGYTDVAKVVLMDHRSHPRSDAHYVLYISALMSLNNPPIFSGCFIALLNSESFCASGGLYHICAQEFLYRYGLKYTLDLAAHDTNNSFVTDVNNICTQV